MMSNPAVHEAIIKHSKQPWMLATVHPIDHFSHLLEGMIAKNESALIQLYESTLPKVYGLALKITRRHDLAEEITEETYMQAWQEAVRYDRTRGPVIAWLLMICRSRALDAIRQLDEAQAYADPEQLNMNAINTLSTLDILLVLERESETRLAVASLNPLQRQLIALAFFKGYTHEEIAIQMGMALGTVKSNLKRAQAKLKSALAL